MELLAAVGASPATLAKILAPFPVAGPASYSDDWHAPRTAGGFHLHEGTDIFADRGTPVIASTDGAISHIATGPSGGLGGTSLDLTGSDGTVYYFAHLDDFAEGMANGTKVTQGQVLGFVGNSGDAEGGATHLHFEIHPDGGEAVPPVPYLDRWVADALQSAHSLRASPATRSVVPRSARSRAVHINTQLARSAGGVASRVAPSSNRSSLAVIAAMIAAAFLVRHRSIVRRRRLLGHSST